MIPVNILICIKIESVLDVGGAGAIGSKSKILSIESCRELNTERATSC